MVLSRLQKRRFYALFNSLMKFANTRLKVVNEEKVLLGASYANSAQAKDLEAEARAEIARETWGNPDVIGDFARENPAGLSEGELDAIASWQEGLSGTFIVDVFPDGVTRFIKGGVAFEACGVSNEPAESFSALPAAVETTLLPFDGIIVPAEYLITIPINFDDHLFDLLDASISHILEHGHIVRTADDLIRVGKLVRETELEQDSAGMFGTSDFDESGDDEFDVDDVEEEWDSLDDLDEFTRPDSFDPDDPNELDGLYDFADGKFGQHEGVLAGLSWEERKEAVDDYLDSELFDEDVVNILKEGCLDKPIARDLATLLSYDDAYDLRKFANTLGANPDRKLSGDALIADIVAHVGDENAIQDIVEQMPLYHISRLKDLTERGGLWKVAEKEAVSLLKLPTYECGLSYAFHEGDSFTFVMPDEVLAQMSMLDWDSAERHAKRQLELDRFADDTAELRGIVAFDDFYDEYRRRYPDGFDTPDAMLEHLIWSIEDQTALFNLIENKAGELYLLHSTLYQAYEEEQGIEDNPFLIQPIHHGELDKSLERLLDIQREKEPRWLTDEMIEAPSLLHWKMNQDAAIAFTQYLDEHVPDECDDYYFADDAMEILVESAMWGTVDGNISTEELFDNLDLVGFVPEPDQVQDLLDLWVSLFNALPTWPNGGWSANELAARGFERAPFVNPDGTPRKIGRNDPCPCGSGKKYKICCGA